MVPRARLFAPLALAALSAAAGLSLGGVFASSRFVVPVLVAVAVAHGVGAACRWRSLPLWATTVLELTAIVVLASVVLGPRFHVLGIELGGSPRSLAHQVRAGWELLRSAPPPVPVTDGALLLAVIVSFAVAAVADWLAFRRDTVLAATAPALVLFVWATTLGDSGQRVGDVVMFATAAAAFWLVQSLAVLDHGRSWLVSKQAARRHWLAPAALLAVVAVVAGVALAPALPGAGAEPLLDFTAGERSSGGSSYRTEIAPLVDVAAKLNDVDDRELFTVAAEQPDYWRVAALDEFSNATGGQWTLRATGNDAVTIGLPATGPSGALHQEYAIGRLAERWLPAAYRPVAIDLDDTLVVTSSQTLVAEASSVDGLRYSVDSVLPPPAGSVTPDMQQATAAPVPARLDRYIELPDNLPPEIGQTAQAIVDNAGATTPYAQAAALYDFFRAGDFVYDATVDPVDTPDAVAAFLRDKRGFCVQFASAYAVMARSLGIPTRVAVGFTSGDLRNGRYHVTAHDAHAWPEIWLAGIGWTHMFDPTPPTDEVAPGGSRVPDEPAPVPPATAVPGATSTATTVPLPVPAGGSGSGAGAPSAPAADRPSIRPEVSAEAPSSGGTPWLVVAVLAVLVAIAGSYVALVLAAKSRRRAHRSEGDPAAAVHGAWEEALDRLREAHVTPDPSLTPLELARVVPTRGAAAARPPMRDLARSYTTARYGDAAVTVDDADRAWSSVDALVDALGADLTRRERWRRRLNPATLRTRAGR